MRVKTTLRKLTDVKVSHISLVERGANRIPFRIIKEDKTEDGNMIDLAKRYKAANETPAAPVVVGIAMFDRGDAIMAGVKEALKAEGFSTEKAETQDDGTVYFEQVPDTGEETHLIRLSDNMAVVVKGFSAYSQQMSENADFGDQVAAQGYYEGMRVACNVFSSAVSNVLYSKDTMSPEDAAAKVSEVAKKFTAYAVALTKGLPAAAFKADNAVSQLLTAKTESEATVVADQPNELENTVDAKTETTVEKTDAEKAAEVAAAAQTTTTAAASTTDAPAVDVASVMKAAMEPVAQALTGIADLLKTVVAKQTEHDTALTEVRAKAEAAEKAVASTTVAAAPGDKVTPTRTVAKSDDSDPRVGAFDTALLPRRN